MTNMKTTRRALFTSIVALVLCFAMLTGTTFAWFTDQETSGNNKIIAGNLDVELYYRTEGQSDWLKVDENTNVFMKDSHWEPGHTEVVRLKVVNAGNLALKYQLGINVIGETPSVNIDGDPFKLSDYILYGVQSGEYSYNRAEAIAAVETVAKSIKSGDSFGGSLPVAAENEESANVYTVVVYMPNSVDNVANAATGEATPEIKLAIDLVATQLANESDSFNNTYDENAKFPEIAYYVNDAADFKSVLAELDAATDIETAEIVLNENIVWETGAGIGSTPLLGDTSSVETLVINGNGNKLTATGKGVGAIRLANGGTLVINNLTIEDESVSYAEGSWEFTYLEFGGKLEFNNVKFNSGIMVEADRAEQTATAYSLKAATPEATAKFIDCEFHSSENSVYSVWVSNGAVVFDGCLFTGTRGLKVAEIYSNSNIDYVTVDGCKFMNILKKPGVVIGSIYQNGETGKYGNQTWTDLSDTTITITNNEFVNCQNYDTECPAGENGIYESDTAKGDWLIIDENTVRADMASETITSGFDIVGDDEGTAKIATVAFGTPTAYADIVANNTPVSTQNGVSTYQVLNGDGKYEVYYLSENDIALPADCTKLFYQMGDIKKIDTSNLDMSGVTNAYGMFAECRALETIDASDWDLSNVENALCMFYECDNLTSIDTSDWVTSSMTNMQSMFYGCDKLEEIDVSNWDTSSVTNMRMVFFRCYALPNDVLEGVENWDVSSVENFYSMFKHARGLTNLDLSKWDTSSATNMSHMFANISGVKTLDLSGFDTSKVTDMSWMFYENLALETIYVGDKWTTEAETSGISPFYRDLVLVGGNGTTWDAACADAGKTTTKTDLGKKYAIVDGTDGKIGLLTYKANN